MPGSCCRASLVSCVRHMQTPVDTCWTLKNRRAEACGATLDQQGTEVNGKTFSPVMPQMRFQASSKILQDRAPVERRRARLTSVLHWLPFLLCFAPLGFHSVPGTTFPNKLPARKSLSYVLLLEEARQWKAFSYLLKVAWFIHLFSYFPIWPLNLEGHKFSFKYILATFQEFVFFFLSLCFNY